jgi:hypothetical protein
LDATGGLKTWGRLHQCQCLIEPGRRDFRVEVAHALVVPAGPRRHRQQSERARSGDGRTPEEELAPVEAQDDVATPAATSF